MQHASSDSSPAPNDSQRGQTLPLIATMMLLLLVFAGLVVDVGNAYRVKDALQASADAAAAAGAGTLTATYPANSPNAIAAAKTFTSATGGKNTITGVPPGNVSQTVTATCVQSNSTVPCTTANTVTVSESASVPTYFLSLLGINSIKITSQASACSPCNELPLDIELVIDRTGSMADDNKMDNLQSTLINGFLPGLDATNDSVGLTVFPPDVNGTSDVCRASSGNANSSAYDANNPTYSVVPLSNDYQTSPGTLNKSSTLVRDINCLQPGGATAYADALEAGYAQLQTNGRAGVQKVIVLLSDGAANTGPNCQDVTTTTTTGSGRNKKTVTTTTKDQDPKCLTPCHAAINDATGYKNSKVLIYTILYGDQSDAPYCLDYSNKDREVPNITPQGTMQQIAGTNAVTGQLDYWADPDPTDLNGVFQEISADMAAGTSRITS